MIWTGTRYPNISFKEGKSRFTITGIEVYQIILKDSLKSNKELIKEKTVKENYKMPSR